MSIRIEIRHADGRSETLLVEGDRALVGNGAHCEVRLPLDQAAVEHVAIEAQGNVVRAKARAVEPAATIDGIAFTEAPLGAEQTLRVGRTDIRAEVAARAAQGEQVVKAKDGKTSPLTYVLVVLAIPLAAFVIFADDDDAAARYAPAKAPELWSAAAQTCPQASPELALGFARERRSAADGKRERRAFHVQDGVAAVPLYETAAACFKTANDAPDADEAAAAAQKLRSQIDEDYRTHRVRLEHALSIKDTKSIQKETRVLLAFTEGKQGDYVTWLSDLDRKLRLQYGRE